jgi:hypothetical protein
MSMYVHHSTNGLRGERVSCQLLRMMATRPAWSCVASGLSVDMQANMHSREVV